MQGGRDPYEDFLTVYKAQMTQNALERFNLDAGGSYGRQEGFDICAAPKTSLKQTDLLEELMNKHQIFVYIKICIMAAHAD